MKDFRNNLLNGDYKFFSTKHISFNGVKDVYIINKGTKWKALVKLTDKHIYPSGFDRINAKLAFQILIHRVTSAIRSCIETAELQFSSAASTTDFIVKYP